MENITYRVIITNSEGVFYEFSGSRENQLQMARILIKSKGGQWSIRVDKLKNGNVITTKNIKR